MTEIPAMPEPLDAALTGADARLRLNHWLPPQNGIAPRICIGRRWVTVLWALPIRATFQTPDRHRAKSSRASRRSGICQATSG